ncbi:MAG: head-tail connector protein [Proteobacteria bacterium]|nr:head-tail connector protein [Pseudomonadota bacterium]
MSIVSLEDMKAHLNIIDAIDDALIVKKIDAAEAHLCRVLGFSMEAEYPEGVPEDLKEAVRQLAAHWYENREATSAGVSISTVPLSVEEIVRERRVYVFG